MTHDIRDLVSGPGGLVALGEPTHREPAFPQLRNELFAQLVDQGFRSIVLEIDRVTALAVTAYVRDGVGSLDAVMAEGFSTFFGELPANRELVAWLREQNERRPPAERLSFHGFDAEMENMSAPSPRRYLEHARDYLGLDLDVAGPAGDDERWSRQEAILDPTESIGAGPEAERLRCLGDDLLVELHARAPELVAATSAAKWRETRTRLTAGLGLLRYHKQAARRVDESTRISGLLATRAALMAQNLLDIRDAERHRGGTLVFANNVHLQRNRSQMAMAGMDLRWYGAGAIVSAVSAEPYTLIVGSLGRSESIGLRQPEPGSYEHALQDRVTGWELLPAAEVAPAGTRTDPTGEQGYFPLDRATLDGADAVLHVAAGTPADLP
ncbi:erythromycin esterase family protein [Micromonospora auratinigra]|uniref:Erythromycin esterase homolog n=1 Tax=Micromonospora auratinigra TaxID=261654 RepID=A0A1A9A1Z3_9ACTN|nr:erythromycin esterase family protein [Micromonospora auratinigra]SBT50448.1 Erythromycin esterase homolog [Micromonospora auratinigra]